MTVFFCSANMVSLSFCTHSAAHEHEKWRCGCTVAEICQ